MPDGKEGSGNYLDLPGKTLAYVQTLPALPKVGLTAVVLLLAGLLIWQIWQKPPVPRAKEDTSGATGSVQGVANSDGSSGSATSGAQSGSAVSSGQTGGITAGNYYQAPPATDQQKAETLARLEAELEELKEFPSRPLAENAPTLLESMLVDKLAFKLYKITDSYYKISIEAVPSIGRRLRDFQKDYYLFQIDEIKLENLLISRISQLPNMKGKIQQASVILLKYVILRESGMTEEQIKTASANVFEPITGIAEEAEGVYESIKNTDEANTLLEKQQQALRLVGRARSLLGEFSTP